jgi:hypothetical protein
MSSARDNDYRGLAARAERDAEDLERRTEHLGREIEDARQSWERKRADRAVPGANPPQTDFERQAHAPRSPAPDAPPENASPFAGETPAEGAVGPAADS